MTGRHYSEDDLVLFFYGEGRTQHIQAHLDTCSACAALYGEIASTLRVIETPAAPDRGERYGLEVWQRIRPVLPSRTPMRAPAWWMNRALFAGAAAAMILLAFFLGRSSRDNAPVPTVASVSAPAWPDSTALVRMAAIGDHLEHSERLLLDFVNAGGVTVDVTVEKTMAESLLAANRIYREAAEAAGDEVTADVLDALERNLIEIAHGPATLTAGDFREARVRLDAAALLFKLRVLSDELHERELMTTPSGKDA